MTIEAKLRGRLRQVVIEFPIADLSSLVRHVARTASHVERRVAAATLRHIDPDLVATQAEIRILAVTFGRLQQLIFVRRTVRIVALDAIADCRRVNVPFDGLGVFFGVASDAKRLRSRGDQLQPGYILIDSDLVAARTAHRHRRVDRLSFRLIRMALEAGLGVGLRIQRNRVLASERDTCREDHKKDD